MTRDERAALLEIYSGVKDGTLDRNGVIEKLGAAISKGSGRPPDDPRKRVLFETRCALLSLAIYDGVLELPEGHSMKLSVEQAKGSWTEADGVTADWLGVSASTVNRIRLERLDLSVPTYIPYWPPPFDSTPEQVKDAWARFCYTKALVWSDSSKGVLEILMEGLPN